MFSMSAASSFSDFMIVPLPLVSTGCVLRDGIRLLYGSIVEAAEFRSIKAEGMVSRDFPSFFSSNFFVRARAYESLANIRWVLNFQEQGRQPQSLVSDLCISWDVTSTLSLVIEVKLTNHRKMTLVINNHD